MQETLSIEHSFAEVAGTLTKPLSVAIVGRQPLLRQGVKQIIEAAEHNACLVEVSDMERISSSGLRCEFLVVFKHIGDAAFYRRFHRLLKSTEGVRPAVVVISETLGDTDLEHVDRGLVNLFLPMNVALDVVGSLLSRLFMQRQLEHGVCQAWISKLRKDFMPDITDLKPVELQVMSCLRHGVCDKDIADSLNVSVPTVKLYIYKITRKLGVRGRINIALLAHRQYPLICNG